MKNVVDASTVLAVCHKEAGADKARDRIRHGLISTVNLSEVLQKSMERQKLVPPKPSSTPPICRLLTSTPVTHFTLLSLRV
ncbi:MAG: hypothetical protein R3E01_04110 [Pirellulaceae bacterium]